jgi:molybdate transport system permease protein
VTPEAWTAVWLTLRLALVSTLVLLVLGTPLAWWLAARRSLARAIVSAVVALPLVLPPTVLGFYLLIALGPRGPIGSLWEGLGGARLVFSFPGLVVGSVCYSLPFVVQPLQNAFQALGKRPLEAAAMLGASPLDRFFSVAVPLARPGFLTAATLGFAHTLGEFGVVLMLGGSIPGRTRVVSIAIFEEVEALRYGEAHVLAGAILLVSFALLLLVYALGGGQRSGLP